MNSQPSSGQYQPPDTSPTEKYQSNNQGAPYKAYDVKESNLKIDFTVKTGYLLYAVILGFTGFFSIIFMLLTVGIALKKTQDTPLLLVLFNGAFSLMGYFIYQTWKAMSDNDLTRARYGRDGFIFSLVSSSFYFFIIFLCSQDQSIIVLVIVNTALHALFIWGAFKIIRDLMKERSNKSRVQSFETML